MLVRSYQTNHFHLEKVATTGAGWTGRTMGPKHSVTQRDNEII